MQVFFNNGVLWTLIGAKSHTRWCHRCIRNLFTKTALFCCLEEPFLPEIAVERKFIRGNPFHVHCLSSRVHAICCHCDVLYLVWLMYERLLSLKLYALFVKAVKAMPNNRYASWMGNDDRKLPAQVVIGGGWR